jgi:hypothetical protein
MARLPWVPRPACAFGAKSLRKQLPSGFGPEVAMIFRDRERPATQNRRAAGRKAIRIA